MLQEESHRLSTLFSGSFYTRLVSGTSAFMVGMFAFTCWAAAHLARRCCDSDGVKSANAIINALFTAIFFSVLCAHSWRIRQSLRKHQADDAILGAMTAMLVSATTALCIFAGVFLRR